MEQYTTATTSNGEQIVVQTSNGQIQQQVTGFTLKKRGFDKEMSTTLALYSIRSQVTHN